MANSRISNSLSYFLEQALILEKNSLETVSKVSDAVTSQSDTVTITLTDPNNPSESITYSIPSFGYLKSEIERLDNTLKTISNVDAGTGGTVRLSDGTYRKIIASKIASEAPTITTTNNVTNFNFKSNWLFEDMMNPYLYANVDLSNCIPTNTERVLIQRYILNCKNARSINYFNNLKKNSTKINYKSFLKGLLNNAITYVLDENYYDLPPIRRRYSGEFEIDRILENTYSSNGQSIIGRLILKSLLYTDNNSGIENTVTLAKNDILEVYENPVTTRYMITSVDTSTNEIRVKRLEGFTPITNATIFKISSNQIKKINVEIPVSFDRREVIFVKAIDPDSNIPSSKWSPGIAFYSNELKYTSPQGVTSRLDTFYQKNVVDFGNVILSYSKDYYPSIVEGIKPDAPILKYDAEDDSASDFKIVQINKQLSEGTEANTFRKLIADKENALSQINNNNKLIEEQKELIQTTKFSTTTEKQNAQNKLSEYVKNQNTYTSLYNSIVNQIKSQFAATYIEKPKYRVRGFWSIPSPKIGSSSGPQQIIQFKIRYRYLSESGVANKEEEFTYLDGTTNSTGRFSNWNEILSPMRRRIKGSDGTYNWEKVNTADPEQININQLDLPIQNGEQIEIQIKSISEAGFPTNPMESDWSDPVIVAFRDFPELQGDDISEIMEQNRVDAAVANVMDGLVGNTSAHMSSSFYTNDKYFAHNAESITSGFLSPEQTPITLYDKLYDLQNQITALTEQIEKSTGSIEVKLIDGEDNTKIYSLNEGGTTYINAGNYVEEKDKIDINKRNGAIITKTYYVDISSDLQSGLEILSKIPGDRLTMCPNSVLEIQEIVEEMLQKEEVAVKQSIAFSTKALFNGENVDNDGSNDDDGDSNDVPTIDEDNKINDYTFYDNVITSNSIVSDYYKYKGRYDLVPINLSASDIIDYQICSPSMYQSAQCKGQFIYSRFRNVSDTFDMYANTENENGIAKFDPKGLFLKGENIYKFKNNNVNDDFWIERFNFYKPNGYTVDISNISKDEKEKKAVFNYIIELYNNLTGSNLSSSLYGITPGKYYMWKNKNISTISKNIITDGRISKKTKFSDKTVYSSIYFKGIYYKYDNKSFDIEMGKNTIFGYYINPCYSGNENYSGYIDRDDTEALFEVNGFMWYNYDYVNNKFTSYETFVLDTDFVYNNEPGVLNIDENFVYNIILNIESVLNRLPKTYKKPTTALRTLYNESKVLIRLNNLSNKLSSNSNTDANTPSINTDILKQNLIKANKIAARTSFDAKAVKNATLNQIEPKIQTAYGFADFGKIQNNFTMFTEGDGSFITTHKIGYEDIDRYRIGENTCDSFLFLSPTNHSEIQVNGDSNRSNVIVKTNESLRVPIIYQYRMEDYNGDIFGHAGYRSTDTIVKNTKYANIIGLDIWTNTLSDTPKQYDIVVYSTYNKDNTRTTGTITKKLL